MNPALQYKKYITVIFICFLMLINFNAKAEYPYQVLDSLCALQRSVQDTAQRLDVLYKIYRMHYNLDSVEKYAILSFRLAVKSKNENQIGNSANVLGWIKFQKKKFIESAKFYKITINICNKKGNLRGEANALSCLGNVYLCSLNYEKGMKLLLKSLQIFSDLGDTAMISSVYRGIGSSCLEYQLYQSGEKYFTKALEIDLKNENPKAIGRDYLKLGLCALYSATQKDTAKKSLARKFFHLAYNYTKENNDFIYNVQSAFHLSLMYAELAGYSKNWNYADSSIVFFNECKFLAHNIGYKNYEENFDLPHAEHLMLAGAYEKAYEVLVNFSKRKKLSYSQYETLSKALELYFHFSKDYKGWLYYIESSDHWRRKLYIEEYGVKFELMSWETDLEIRLKEYEKNKINRNLEIQREQIHHELLRKIMTYLILPIFFVTITFIIFYIRNNRLNEVLKKQKEKILSANNMLAIFNDEIRERSIELETQTKEIKHQRNKLASINLRIVLNMEIAGRLQQSVVISPDSLRKIFNGAFVVWRPLDTVSGDFYWATEIEGVKFAALADCTGHGIPGACLSMLGTALLNGIAARINVKTAKASDILNKLKTRIRQSLSQGIPLDGDEVHDGMDISLCIIDEENDRLSYSGAYRPLWTIKNNSLTEWKADRISVAIDQDHDGDFSDNEMKLSEIQSLYMFSDGITDQFGIMDGKLLKFKHKRLRNLVEEIFNEPSICQKQKIEQAIDNWAKNIPQTDDILVVGIKFA